MAIDIEHAYARYGPLVYRRCHRLLRNEAQAEEAMHDVFVRLLRHRESLDDREMAGLMFRMATQVSLNRLRTRARKPEHGDGDLLHAIAHCDDTEGQGTARALLLKLLGREDASTRVIATLRFVDEMTLEEVATEVGMSVSGVRKRLRGLQRRLATSLEVAHG